MLDQVFGAILLYIPFYFLIKLLFLIWLQNPITLGASVIYKEYLRNVLKKYEKEIEQLANVFDEKDPSKSEQLPASDEKKEK
mmetsp:Transcript_4734/g.8095  ORF Transcript_4734/g.8095 Transcript_4734/m.8095 type:complete len:82 (-) Transcript_4734:38-283(-)